jgi:transcriptional regulator with XRE-family HTH domain
MFAVAKLNGPMNAPESLKAWRIAKGISQKEAGKLLEPAVTATTWCDWENGKKVPRVDRSEDIEVITGRTVRQSDWAEFARQRGRDAGAGHA